MIVHLLCILTFPYLQKLKILILTYPSKPCNSYPKMSLLYLQNLEIVTLTYPYLQNLVIATLKCPYLQNLEIVTLTYILTYRTLKLLP